MYENTKLFHNSNESKSRISVLLTPGKQLGLVRD